MRLGALLCVAAFATSCATRPVAPPAQAELEARAWQQLQAITERGGRVLALQAELRSELSGQSGEAFSRQLLLLERPARFRVEVMGLLGQRALVLATDGVSYDLYQATTGRVERGTVHAALLFEQLGVPLAPDEAVAVLLATPPLPAGGNPPEITVDAAQGGIQLAFGDRSYAFDPAGRLARYDWHPEGHTDLRVSYADWRETGAEEFPFRVQFDLPASGDRLALRFQSVALNPTIPVHAFRIPNPGGGAP